MLLNTVFASFKDIIAFLRLFPINTLLFIHFSLSHTLSPNIRMLKSIFTCTVHSLLEAPDSAWCVCRYSGRTTNVALCAPFDYTTYQLTKVYTFPMCLRVYVSLY